MKNILNKIASELNRESAYGEGNDGGVILVIVGILVIGFFIANNLL